MIRTVTCYAITCDICSCEYDSNGVEERTLHFETADQAFREVITDGWTADAGRLICRSCVYGRNRARCAVDGHIWGHWTPCCCQGRLPDHALMGCDLIRCCLRPGCDAEQASSVAALPSTDEPPRPGS